MATQKKIETVEELREQVERCVIAIGTEYRGLTVTEMGALRRAMRDAGIEVRVVKNRLFARAATEAGRPEMAGLVEGPTAIVFGYEDVVAPAKAVTEYAKSARNAFAVRRGMMDGRALSLADIEDLASLPSREQLIAQLAGGLRSPIANLLGLLQNLLANPAGILLNDTMRTFGGLLEARAQQLEGA
jgi:large subunit ribosomal protein L10